MPAPLSRKLFRRERAPLWRRWRVILGIFLVATLVGAGWFAYWALTPLRFSTADSVEVYVAPGARLRSVSAQLRDSGVELDELPFLVLARLTRNERSIRVGAYEFSPGSSPWVILSQLRLGKVVQSSIVIPEGWTFAQIRSRLDANPDLSHATVGLSTDEILKALDASEKSLEGILAPDRYHFDKRSSDLDLMRRAYQIQRKRLAEAWDSRAEGISPKNPYEALILASIVEKESGVETDRALIGAVFNNRLRLGMRLQSDPTVIFGMGEEFDGNLRKKDLSTPTDYNTYVIRGLPPTPIGSVSVSALRAVTQPANASALYFVARGDGTSEFSDSLAAHNRAVSKFQLKGR